MGEVRELRVIHAFFETGNSGAVDPDEVSGIFHRFTESNGGLSDTCYGRSFYVSLALLKFRGNKPLANFIALLTGTEEFQKEAELHSLQFAIPMKINLGQISDLRVRIPAEESEIKAIITMLNDMGSEIKRLEQKLNKYKLLKQGMMEELLTGKVRLM